MRRHHLPRLKAGHDQKPKKKIPMRKAPSLGESKRETTQTVQDHLAKRCRRNESSLSSQPLQDNPARFVSFTQAASKFALCVRAVVAGFQ